MIVTVPHKEAAQSARTKCPYKVSAQRHAQKPAQRPAQSARTKAAQRRHCAAQFFFLLNIVATNIMFSRF